MSTHRDDKIYLHVLNRPADKVTRTSVLTGGDVSFDRSADQMEITVAPASRNEIDTIVILELDQPASGIKPIQASVK